MAQERLIPTETIISMDSVPIRFGVGATEEVGYELTRLGIRQALLVTDRNLRQFGLVDKVEAAARSAGIELDVYDDVHIEPTDRSFNDAIAYARKTKPQAFISLGGGSTIDTAKIMNLLSTHPGEILDYVNKPIGQGKPVPGPLKPHIAMPTTAGTGAETTAVIILDMLDIKLKSGISHRYNRPTLAIIDPLNSLSCPPFLTAAAGFDVLCHAAESYTCRPYDSRPRVTNPADRPAYIGSNPIADLWCDQAISWCGTYLRRAVYNPLDIEARSYMMLASTFAGIGFGNAGVHIPHAMAYPVAGMVRDYFPPDFNVDEPLIPHGLSVVVNAPAAFRYTAPAWPERHARVAELLGTSTAGLPLSAAGEAAADAMERLMKDLGMPSGLEELGYGERDLPELIDGTLKQQRLLIGSPRPVDGQVLDGIFRDAMRYW